MGDAELGAHEEVVSRQDLADARLRSEVVSAARGLEQLLQHRDLLGAEVSDVITSAVSEVQRRLDRKELAVVVVGEKKAGKSTFLNAILGARVLPTEVRECTATVTFIRRAPRPTYRATLQSGETIEFQPDVEAPERAKLASAIENLRQRLGDVPERTTTMNHEEASRARLAAEVANRECDLRLADAAAEAQRAAQHCDLCLASATQLEEQLVAARSRLQNEERAFAASSADLRRDAERQGLAMPGTEASDLAATSITVKAAEIRLAHATAAAPFFLRKAPWWAFWVIVLRLVLQWFFRARGKALADARDHHQFARLSLAACEAAGRRDDAKRVEADAAARLDAARQDLANAHERVRAAEAEKKAAEERLATTRATLAECQHAEELAELAVLYTRADALEEQFAARFRSEVSDLTDMEKRGHDVLELTIEYPARHLPDGITIIDTPGVNTDNASNRDRAWDVIRRNADGCLFVSDLQQVVSRSTREFLQEVRAIIPHILLVMTKVDGALANAHIVNLEPWQRVEEARRNGVRRFAKEIGRAPEEVFSIAVAAEPALRRDFSGDLLARRFPGEVAKLFELLQAERDLVLGARAAAAVRYCIQRIAEAETTAEGKYRQRIAELEEHRLPDPGEFQARQLAKVEQAVRAHANAIAKRARDATSAGLDQLERNWVNAITACSSKDEVKALIARLGEDGQDAIAGVMRGVEQAVTQWSGDAIKQLEAPLLEELRERYRIVQKMTGSGMAIRFGGVRAGGATSATELQANVAGAVSNFESEQIAFGAGGAIAGAAIGTIIMPGIGTAIGAAIGALATYLKTLDSLKNDCLKELGKGLGDARQNLTQQLDSMGPDVQRTMREVLARALADAVTRFDSWIKQVMTEERRHIDQQREKLSHLIKSREALIMQDRTLAAVQRATATLSRGLCA